MLMTTLGRTKEQGVTMLVIPIYDIIAVRKLILGGISCRNQLLAPNVCILMAPGQRDNYIN